ncbi:MAG: hypothetical protein R3291_00315, partial [Thermoplasmata archaeon]|nr:hypothetical protein [Thermoplasmata archaeon]
SMSMATLELTIASNADMQQDAFQAAETGIDIPLGQRNFNTVGVTDVLVEPAHLVVQAALPAARPSSHIAGFPKGGFDDLFNRITETIPEGMDEALLRVVRGLGSVLHLHTDLLLGLDLVLPGLFIFHTYV